jgi:hypothetical protein
MEGRGAIEKAKKVRQRCGKVFRYAIVTGRAEYNPAPDLTSAMSGHESKNYPFLTPAELPNFFQSLSEYTGSDLIVLAARLLIMFGKSRQDPQASHAVGYIEPEKIVQICWARSGFNRPALPGVDLSLSTPASRHVLNQELAAKRSKLKEKRNKV